MKVARFIFNDFSENTYVLYDETKECVIIDPGCYTNSEQNELRKFIQENGLNPVKLINTHCHIDHVLGNSFVANTFSVALYLHKEEL
ncbi:MAG: MBL fold metallo-hydrolase, partial [Bacteroidia bacterium]|nr:MBL fold metallo-hydrolase [Bacteroidia bacterium]